VRLVYGGGGVGVGSGYEISCVLSREGDVGAWVLLCRPRPAQYTIHKTHAKVQLLTSLLLIYQPEDGHKSRNM
jgi:hypothetical protein